MTHQLLVAGGDNYAEALDALSVRLSGTWSPTASARDGVALAAGSHLGRREQSPSEIARNAIAYQDAQRAQGVNLPVWQAVDAVM